MTTQQYRLQAEHDALNRRLKQTIRFTEEDLVANRDGQLTPTQQVEVRTHREADSCLIWIIGLGVAFVACLLVMSTAMDSKTDSSALIIAIVCGLALVVGGVVSQGSFTTDIQNSMVMSARGPIKKRYGSNNYFIRIDLTSIQVSHEIYDAFIEGQSYILYYTPNSMTLVAAEHILSS